MTKYWLIPRYNKSLMETQTWHRTLKTGKQVTLKVYTTYRCFNIEIDLNDAEKAKIIKMNTIPLDNRVMICSKKKWSFYPWFQLRKM